MNTVILFVNDDSVDVNVTVIESGKVPGTMTEIEEAVQGRNRPSGMESHFHSRIGSSRPSCGSLRQRPGRCRRVPCCFRAYLVWHSINSSIGPRIIVAIQ